MGNWTSKSVVLEPIEFDGDSITFHVKRLLVEDMQVLAKYFDGSKGMMSFDNPLDVCKTAQEIFPKYVTGIKGLLDAEGHEVSVEQFLEASKEFYFVPLIGELFAKLIDVSTAKAQLKNSAPPSPE